MNEEYFVDKELYDDLSASFSALEIQLDKYKNVIDKIKEKLKEDLKYGRSKDHLWLMGYYDACKDINKLLEEVE